MVTIESVANKALKVCEQQGRRSRWSEGGCYLYLEVSEFIEGRRTYLGRSATSQPDGNKKAAKKVAAHLVWGMIEC